MSETEQLERDRAAVRQREPLARVTMSECGAFIVVTESDWAIGAWCRSPAAAWADAARRLTQTGGGS